VRPINVVFVGVTGMLSDIVREILDQPDIRVSAELPHGPDSAARAGAASADVVILFTAERAVPATVGALLAARPSAKVLTIRDDGRMTSLFELRPYETALGQISRAALLAAVRAGRA
jgi:hypothetical protein